LKVVEDGKRVDVEFTLEVTCNELGQKTYSTCDVIDQGIWIATIELYDNGWQISSIQERKNHSDS